MRSRKLSFTYGTSPDPHHPESQPSKTAKSGAVSVVAAPEVAGARKVRLFEHARGECLKEIADWRGHA